MILRPYQNEAAASVIQEFEKVSSTLVVLPTGTGKTILLADIIRRMFPRRALVLAHRQELIFQAQEKIHLSTGLSTGIEMGKYRVQENNDFFGNAQVIISSIQSQISGYDGKGRMCKFQPDHFGLVVIDESHHSTSSSYKRVIDYYKQNPEIKILGVTATPDRADEEALGQVYETVAYDYEILDAIHDGWLVPIKQQMIEVAGLDFSRVHTTAGDLNGGELAKIMEFEENLHSIASPTMEIIGDKRTIVFTASVIQAERLAEIFNRHKPNCAAWVCGKTKKEERQEILSNFTSGATQIVCNCGILTEGFDNPGVEVIIMGRPTKSRSLYAQMAGRAIRPLPGVVDGPETASERKYAIMDSAKPECLIVDFVGNSGRHKLMSSADILGGKVSKEAVELAIAKARKGGKPMDMDRELTIAEEEIKKEKEEKLKREQAKRLKLQVKAKWNSRSVNPFDVWDITPTKEGWRDKGRSLSEKQIALLEKNGIVGADEMPYQQSKQILNEMFRRWDTGECTFKQAKTLKKYDLPTDVSVSTASKLIDAIANNNWRRPLNADAIIQQEQLREVPF